MAIPTQFSVAKTRKCPIANPTQSVDGANPLTAEDVGFISGASTMPAKDAAEVGDAVVIGSEQQAAIDNAVSLPAENIATIDDPNQLTAQQSKPVETDIELVNRQYFNFTNTDNDWLVENATLTVNATSITVTNTGADGYIYRFVNDYNKTDSYIVRVRLRCITNSINSEARVYYRNSEHGYELDYSVAKNVTFEQGEYQLIDFNLRGDDFNLYGADTIRIDFYSGAAAESFEIDYIHIGAYEGEFTPKAPKDINQASALTSEAGSSIDVPSELNAKPSSNIDAPSALTAENTPSTATPTSLAVQNAPNIPLPNVITANVGTLTSPPFPLNHARILYDNVLKGYSSLSVTNAQNAAFALTYNTSQKWTFTGGNVITVDLPANVDIDTICVGAHTLGSGNFTVGAEWSADATGGFTPLTPGKTPDNDGPLMFHLSGSTVSARRIRILVANGTQGGIGYISAGIALQMQRPFFNGHQPFIDSDVTEFYNKRTESGERIGRDIRRKGYETSFEWQNLDDGWYRQYIPAFKEAAKIVPFFVAWNLLEYPDDIAFGETTDDMGASMQNGTRTKRNGFSFTLAGV